MKGFPHRLLFLCMVLFWVSAGSTPLQAQEVAIFKKFEDLREYVHKAVVEDSTVVVNFWATWCRPCVEELPSFDTLQQRYGKKLKVILVSLDLQSRIDSRVLPFLQAQPVTPKVVILTDQDGDSWIPKVDGDWEGQIPFTWVLQGKSQRTYAEKFHSYAQLESFVWRK